MINHKKCHRIYLLLKAYQHPLRQRILRNLRNTELSVTQLYIAERCEQAIMSQHLAALRSANLVTTRKEGKSVYYSVNENRVKQINAICVRLSGGNLLHKQSLEASIATMRAVTHKLRLEIIELIDSQKTMKAGDIHRTLCISQSLTSSHLKILRNANVVKGERKSKNIYYTVNYSKLADIADVYDV